MRFQKTRKNQVSHQSAKSQGGLLGSCDSDAHCALNGSELREAGWEFHVTRDNEFGYLGTSCVS